MFRNIQAIQFRLWSVNIQAILFSRTFGKLLRNTIQKNIFVLYIMDNLVFEESINTEVTSSEFVDKQWLYVNDNNNGSYSGQIVLDTTSLSNSGSYINWSEAFIALPLVLQAEGSATAITASNSLDYLMGMKNGFWQILHSMSVEFNNGSIIQQTPFLNVFCSFKNLTSWSQNDIQNWGAICGFCPDTSRSWLYNNNSTANSLLNFENTSGQGFCNNRTCPYVTLSAYGYWTGSLVTATATAVTAITTLTGQLQVGMMISGPSVSAGTYITAIVYAAGVPSTATLSAATTGATTNVMPMVGISQILPYNPDAPCGDDSDNLRQNYNAGLQQRIAWLNFSLSNLGSAVTPTLANSLTSNQSSLLAGSSGTATTSVASNSALNQIFQSYIQKASTTRSIIFDAVIRLKDIADFYQKCPLLKGSTMRIYLNTNQVYFTIGACAGEVAGTVSTTALSAGASTSQTNTDSIALTSTPVILGGGGTNPVMVSSMDIGQGAYNLVPLAQTLPAAPESVKIGLSIVRTQFLSGQFTTSVSAPVTSVRLYAPAYTMSPIAEQRYLSLTPTKKIVYNDLFQYSFTGVASGQTFSFLVTNGIPNIRGILVIPLLPKASNGVASTYPTTTPLAGVTTSTLLSPFSTTGGTPDPISLTNFQIQISGKNLFINNLQYDYETFYEQLVSSNQLNGSLTTSLSSGLIGFAEFENLYRYYYGNAGRSIPSEDGVAKAVQVSGVNNSPNTIDFMVFIEFERQIVVDVRTGARVQ